MKIVILSDNRSGNPDYKTEHGLAVYVETEVARYLLDTGASGLLVQNAVLAGVDLSSVEWVILSHGHSDHTGGLEAFFSVNTNAKVVVARGALNQHLYSKRNGFREIGSHADLNKHKDRFVFVEEWTEINSETVIFKVSELPYNQPLGNETLYKGEAVHPEPDDFSHELVAVIGNEKALVFTGCAHKGLLNILHAVQQQLLFRPWVVLGGFHLVEKTVGQAFETEADILNIAALLQELYPDTRFFTGHCTGDTACRLLTESMNGKLQIFGTGNEYLLT
jgi:7,8-dihydropterin-6-yl-methyl-4-(beta-D-ribofuranosyl)aminobenzene 5'-phosphate synthase